MPLSVEAIPALETNYIWALHNGRDCVIVDPGSPAEPLDWMASKGLDLRAILVTHHHWDHTGGIDGVLSASRVPVWGPRDDRIGQITHPVSEGDRVELPELDVTLNTLEVPGHTTTHIALHDEERLFSGDTLFSVGCGRMFEGTPEQMVASLDKLADLPGNLQVHCGHEYTLANSRFALEVEPDNERLRERAEEARRLRDAGRITLPSTLEEERAVNPFLRTREAAVIEAASRREPGCGDDPAAVFGVIRRWKDSL